MPIPRFPPTTTTSHCLSLCATTCPLCRMTTRRSAPASCIGSVMFATAPQWRRTQRSGGYRTRTDAPASDQMAHLDRIRQYGLCVDYDARRVDDEPLFRHSRGHAASDIGQSLGGFPLVAAGDEEGDDVGVVAACLVVLGVRVTDWYAGGQVAGDGLADADVDARGPANGRRFFSMW